MAALRVEADDSTAKVGELQIKVRTLEQDNMVKEQEITSLKHRNGLLDAEIEKLETNIKEAKAAADESSQHGKESETLQRKLQKLEQEAEESDKNLRETNDKYVLTASAALEGKLNIVPDSAKRMSRPVTLSGRSRLSSALVISGRPSTKKWLRSMPKQRRSLTTSSPRLATSRPRACMAFHDCSWDCIHISLTASLVTQVE